MLALLPLLAGVPACKGRAPTPAGGDAGAVSAPPHHNDSGADPATPDSKAIELARQSPDPYVRWIFGVAGAVEAWPAAPLPAIRAAATAPANAFAATDMRWNRRQNALGLSWDLRTLPTRTPCTPLVDAVKQVLVGAGYTPIAGATGDQLAYTQVDHGISRDIRFGCTDGHADAKPGCGDSVAPPQIHVGVSLEIPAPAFKGLDDALAPFPQLLAGALTTAVPRFLVDRANDLEPESLGCDAATHGVCVGDFSFWLRPPADPRTWILATMTTAADHGFWSQERHEDPRTDWIASTQDCSGRNLWYKIERDLIWMRLAVILGAPASGDAVTCSAQATPVVPDKPDPKITSVLDTAITQRAALHLATLAGCYVDHQRHAGRTAVLGDWRRLGDYLERNAVDAQNSLGGTFGFEHHRGRPPADGFYLRTRRPVAGGGSVELYAVQDSFTQAFGRVVLTVMDANGSKLYEVQLGMNDLGGLASQDGFERAALAAIDGQITRSLAGTGRLQECNVLANGGQECDTRDATPKEQASARARLETTRQQLTAAATAGAGAVHAAIADMLPFEQHGCELFLPGAPL